MQVDSFLRVYRVAQTSERVRKILFFIYVLCYSATIANCQKVHTVILKAPGYIEHVRSNLIRKSVSHRELFELDATKSHDNLLRSILGSQGHEAKLHDFTESVRGFSALLSVSEAKSISGHPDVLFVAEDRRVQLFTTRTPTFLGLNNSKTGIWRRARGSNMVVGMIDSGIWPEDSSFSASGYSATPKTFKGACVSGTDATFKCNRKVVGGRYFGAGLAASQGTTLRQIAEDCGDFLSPRDFQGHGSHVASIAAGGFSRTTVISGVNFGPARGMACGARLAVYKVFWCAGDGVESDVAKAMDAAVKDGVDVLSLSLGFNVDDKYSDSRSVLSYFAYKVTIAGVPVVFAAGNRGPSQFSLSNSYPWVLTVGAGTIDRTFTVRVKLGSGRILSGLSYYNPGTSLYSCGRFHPLIYARSTVVQGLSAEAANFCNTFAMDLNKVKDKIVLCERLSGFPPEQYSNIVTSGKAKGIIFFKSTEDSVNVPLFFPYAGASLSKASSDVLKQYMSQSSPRALIFPRSVNVGPAQVEAPFVGKTSSLGPNPGTLNILKPDIIAPGTDIIGAGSYTSKPYKSADFQFLSGTSMACPHVAGVVALLKAIHPSWSPSMLFSAIMTTAGQKTNRNNLIRSGTSVATPFHMGTGQISPNAAVDPGLVFPISNSGYNKFLCSPDSRLSASGSLFKPSLFCSKYPSTQAVDMNLPSVSFFASKVNFTRSTLRVMMNVGSLGTYYAKVYSNSGARLWVSPSKLVFGPAKLSYTIQVRPYKVSKLVTGAMKTGSYYWTFGKVIWYDNKGHSVRLNVVLNAV